MDVIGHHDPCAQIIQSPPRGASQQDLAHAIGDLRVFQPQRAADCFVHVPIYGDKCFSCAWTNDPGVESRQGAVQPPCDKEFNLLWLPMREASPIECHEGLVLRKGKTLSQLGRAWPCPTAISRNAGQPSD